MRRNTLLLSASILTAPIFIGLSLVLAMASPHFSLMRHELSLLLSGSVGTIQSINFYITGILGLLLGLGLWHRLHGQKAGTWGPILLGLYGIAFLIAGTFHPDPQLGYPAGAPSDVPRHQSAASNMHSLAFSVLALSVVAAGFVFARRFSAQGKKGWALYSRLNSIALFICVMLGSALMPKGDGGLPLLGAAIAITGWVSMIAYYFTTAKERKTA